MSNALHFGDNLYVLREDVRDESVDLVYLDPPFTPSVNYNVLFQTPKGKAPQAQLDAFIDTWHWGEVSAMAYDDVVRSGLEIGTLLGCLKKSLGESPMMAYLSNMSVRLIELHRVLKGTGSLYLHCDPTTSHYLKILMDALFDPANFRTEINWKRSSAHSDAKQGRKLYGNVRDVMLFYTKGKDWTWNWLYTPYDDSYIDSAYRHIELGSGRRYRSDNLSAAKPGGDTEYHWRVKRKVDGGEWEADIDGESDQPKRGWEYQGVPPYKNRFWAYSRKKMIGFSEAGRLVYSSSGMRQYKRYLDEMPGVPLQNDWRDIPPASGKEYLGYPTQKPLRLLDRVVGASSNPGDVVLDPYCGCGTTIHAAETLGREWFGIDTTHHAVEVIENRLGEHCPNADYEVTGRPVDLASARDLAKRDKYEFQWWATWYLGAEAYRGKKKGGDRGIDGFMFYNDGPGADAGRVIISVKGGDNVGPGMIRDLIGVMDNEDSEMGLFITLAEPTSGMTKAAASAGFFHTQAHGSFPRVQILTIGDLYEGKDPKLPPQFHSPTQDEIRALKKIDPRQREMMLEFPTGGEPILRKEPIPTRTRRERRRAG